MAAVAPEENEQKENEKKSQYQDSVDDFYQFEVILQKKESSMNPVDSSGLQWTQVVRLGTSGGTCGCKVAFIDPGQSLEVRRRLFLAANFTRRAHVDAHGIHTHTHRIHTCARTLSPLSAGLI